MIGSFGVAELGSNEFLLPFGITPAIATIRERIYGMLKRDAMSAHPVKLGSMLGKSSTPPFGVYFMAPPEKPDFPLVTYNVVAEAGRSRPRVILMNIVVWGGSVEAMLGRIHKLLDNTKLGDITTGWVPFCRWSWASPDIFDEDYEVHVGINRYMIKEVRAC